jgi:aldehyde dehydrogenase (NAD+)
VAACARYFEFYAGAPDKFHGETIPYPAGYTVLTWREPHGVTGHIIPWNYPLQIFGRSVGAALAAGNACVVKPAEDACLSLLRVAELAAGIGLPEGALNIVTGLGGEAGAALAMHPGIEHLSFTGSPATGAWVAAEAAKRHCPVTLELGGKGAQVVFADADLDAALPVIVNAIVQNAGQTCSAGSRLLVEESRYEEVLERLGVRFAALRVGPALADLDCGPLIRPGQLERVRGFLADAERDGHTTVAKGTIVADAPVAGYYVEPRLLRDVPPSCRLACEEVFGPVLAAMPIAGEGDAVRIANATDFGLVTGVWTRDGGRQLRMARAIRSGQVFVNSYGAGGGVELPFGGVKHSGYGREKGFEALYGLTVLKTVVLHHG